MVVIRQIVFEISRHACRSDFYDLFRRRVTLTVDLDLLTPKLIISCLAPWTICVKIGSVVCVHRLGNERTDGRTDGQIENVVPV